MKLFCFLMLTLLSAEAFAVTGSYWNAMRAKDLIAYDASNPVLPAESIVLPISRGMGQGSSELCWAFATLSFLESNYLADHGADQGILFSRAAMQRNNIEERAYRKYVLTGGTFMERGTFMNAFELIKKYGLMPYDGRNHNVISSVETTIRSRLTGTTPGERTTRLKEIVDGLYFPMPANVTFEGRQMSHEALRTLVAGEKIISYAFKRGSTGQWGNHPDSDAFTGLRSWYVDPSEKEAIIKEALTSGHALEMSFDAHSVLIFGADYDDAGKATKYYIKDSYTHGAGYTYEASAERLHSIVWELGTVDLRGITE